MVPQKFPVQLHPLVEPQVLHFMQVPLRTRVKLPQAPQLSPSKPFIRASARRLLKSRPAPLDDSATSMLATCAPTGLEPVITCSIPARISDRSSGSLPA